MNTNLENLLGRFYEWKHSAFWGIGDLLIPQVQDYFFSKTQNASLSEHLTLHTMDQLLNCMYAGNFSLQEDVFRREVFHLADQQLEKYENLINNRSQTENFQAQLKLKLKSRLSSKRAQDPNYFAFYWHHFRFYFMGACFVVGVGILAFLLGFMSFHKHPDIFKKNPKLFVMTGNEAFWPLEKETRSFEPMLDHSEYSFFSSLPKQYRITEKQIPQLSKTIRVAKINSDFSFPFSELKTFLQTPALKLDKDLTGDILKLDMLLNGYEMQFDMKTQKLNLISENLESLADVEQPLLSEKKVIKEVKKQMKALWLSLEQYGDFEQQTLSREDSQVWMVFHLPRLVNGKEVYNDALYIEYNVIKGKIGTIQNYAFGTYDLSEYPVNNSSEAIFEQLLEAWVDVNKKEDENTITLPKWEIKYIEKENWLLKPVLIFDKDGQKIFVDIL